MKKPKVKVERHRQQWPIRRAFLRFFAWLIAKILPYNRTYQDEYNFAIQVLHFAGLHYWKGQSVVRAQQLNRLQVKKRYTKKRKK